TLGCLSGSSDCPYENRQPRDSKLGVDGAQSAPSTTAQRLSGFTGERPNASDDATRSRRLSGVCQVQTNRRRAARRRPWRHLMSKRFRIAFSFSGDKRESVAEIAGILAGHFGEDRVLYDKYHEAEFARPDLAFYLPSLYYNEADLVVAIWCNDYKNKEWCGLE